MKFLRKYFITISIAAIMGFSFFACSGGGGGSSTKLEDGEPVDIINAKTEPSAPDRLCAIAGEQKVTVTWSEGLGAENYSVWYNTDEDSSGAVEADEQNKTDTICIVEGLEKGKKYYFWVKSINSKGQSHFSQHTNATVPDTVSSDLRLSIGDLTVTEGTDTTPDDYSDNWQKIKIPITLSGQPKEGRDVTVNWIVIGNSSILGYDTGNMTKEQSISFNSTDPLTKYAELEISKDNYCENTESFKVVISKAVNAMIEKPVGTVTIEDDDETIYTIKIGDPLQTIEEGSRGETVSLRFPIEVNPPLKAGDKIKVHWDYGGTANPRGDAKDYEWYDSRRHTRWIDIDEAGYTSGGFLPLEIFGDSYIEKDETVTIKLEDCVNARPVIGHDMATGIIRNDDTGELAHIEASMQTTLVTVSEGGEGINTAINVNVKLSEPVPSGKVVSLNWAVEDVKISDEAAEIDKDYTGSKNGVLTINQGNDQGTIEFKTIGDFIAGEGIKKFRVVLEESEQVLVSNTNRSTLCWIEDVGITLVKIFDVEHQGSGINNHSPVISSDGAVYHMFDLNGRSRLFRLTPELDLVCKRMFDDDIRISLTLGDDDQIYTSTNDNIFRELIYTGNSSPFEIVNEIHLNEFISSPAIAADGTVYGRDQKDLYSIKNGTVSTVLDQGRCSNGGPVIGKDGTVYLASGGNGYCFYAFNPDGTEKWRRSSLKWINSTPAIGKNGWIYTGSDSEYGPSKLYAFNPESADDKLAWAFTAEGHIKASPVIDRHGNIYFGTGGYDNNTGANRDLGYFYCLTPDGNEKWKYDMNKKRVLSTAAIGSSGTIYVGCEDGFLYAFDSDGNVKWKYNAGDCIYSAITIYKDIVYLSTEDGDIHAIRVEGENGLDPESPWPKFQCDLKNTGRAK